jgi:hypothetical protein
MSKDNRRMAIWECKIGLDPDTFIHLPDGCDAPMRHAVRLAFKAVTGLDADFLFSGWSAELTPVELKVVRRTE